MKFFKKYTINILLIILIYLLLALVSNYSFFISFTFTADQQQFITTWHHYMSSGLGAAPNVFRFLSFWIPCLLSYILNVPIYLAYQIQYFIFTFLIFVFFHFYLMKWFNQKFCFLSVVLLASFLSAGNIPSLFQPSDTLNLLLFLIGVWLIRSKKEIWLFPLIFVATFNRETSIFIIIFYFIINVKSQKINSFLIKIFGYSLIWAISLLITRLSIFSYRTYDFLQLIYNLKRIYYLPATYPLTNLFVFTLLLLVIMGFVIFNKNKINSLFLRRSLWFIPIFLIIHLFFARLNEPRLFLPLMIVIIPLILIKLFPEELKSESI